MENTAGGQRSSRGNSKLRKLLDNIHSSNAKNEAEQQKAVQMNHKTSITSHQQKMRDLREKELNSQSKVQAEKSNK